MYISKCCLWDVGAEWTRKRKSVCVFSLLNCFSGLVLWISSCCLLSILVLLHADFTTLTVKLMHTVRFENVYCYTLYSMESSSASLMRMPMTCFTVSCWFILSTVAIISVLSEEWLYIDCLHLGSGQNLQLGLIMLAYAADSDRPSSLHNLCVMTISNVLLTEVHSTMMKSSIAACKHAWALGETYPPKVTHCIGCVWSTPSLIRHAVCMHAPVNNHNHADEKPPPKIFNH